MKMRGRDAAMAPIDQDGIGQAQYDQNCAHGGGLAAHSAAAYACAFIIASIRSSTSVTVRVDLKSSGENFWLRQVLQLHDQIDRIDGIEVEVLIEPRVRRDLLGRDLENLDRDRT